MHELSQCENIERFNVFRCGTLRKFLKILKVTSVTVKIFMFNENSIKICNSCEILDGPVVMSRISLFIHKARNINVIASRNWQRLNIEIVKAKQKACKLENFFKGRKSSRKKLSQKSREKN